MRNLIVFATLCLGGCIGSSALGQDFNFERMPAQKKYSIQINVPNTFPQLSDGDAACEIAIAAMPPTGWQVYSNIRYVDDNYAGCHHTLTYVAPNPGGYPIGSSLEKYGQNWVIPVPSCPTGYDLVRIYNPDHWACSKPAARVDPKKPGQCAGINVEVGNPVSCSGAEKVERRIDDVTRGFELTQTFSSLPDSYLSPFGKGWSSLLTSRVEVDEGMRGAFLFLDNGKVIPFIRESGGRWLTQSDLRRYELTQVNGPDGTLTGWRYRLGAQVSLFDSKGRIVAIERSGTIVVSIGYDSLGQPVSIFDRQGREASIEYAEYMRASALRLPDGASISFEYDDLGRLTSVLKADGSVNYQYVAGPAGYTLLASKVDGAGITIGQYGYDAHGRATSTEGAGGVNKYGLTYSGDSNDVIVTTPLGAVREFEFDVFQHARRLRRVTESCAGCSNSETLLEYDPLGYILRINKGGLSKNFARDAKGRVTLVSEDGRNGNHLRTTETQWHPEHDVPTLRRISDADGRTVSEVIWGYDNAGKVVSEVLRAAGVDRTTNLTYCGQGDSECPLPDLLKEESNMSGVTSYRYYADDAAGCASTPECQYRRGDLKSVVGPMGNEETFLSYDGGGRLLSHLDANGISTHYGYDAAGRLSTVQRSVGGNFGRSISLTYDPAGLVRQIVDADGIRTIFSYDEAHRLIRVEDGLGNWVTYTRDVAGNPVHEELRDASGNLRLTLARIYNQRDQLVTLADASANPTDYVYDANGNQTRSTDALGRVSDSSYDPLDRLAGAIQDPGGIAAATGFAYDAADNLTKVTDPKGLDTTYTYNGFGEVLTQTSPDTGTTTFTYDAAGNVATRTDARGLTTTYSYDALNRPLTARYPDPSSDVAYTYDIAPDLCPASERYPVGRMSTMVDGSGRTSYCYNAFGEVVRKVQEVNGQPLVLRYSYTPGGRLASITYPDGTLVDYVRNTLGQIAEVGVTSPAGNRQVLVTGAGYLPFGPSTGWQYGNGRSLSRTFDLDYRPTGIADNRQELALSFGYDPVGNLTVLNVGGEQHLIDYDALGRLTAFRDAVTGTAIETYGYDATGNRLLFANASRQDAYTYPSDSHRLTAVAGIARTYDAAGNTTSVGGTSKEFVYDDRGRLVVLPPAWAARRRRIPSTCRPRGRQHHQRGRHVEGIRLRRPWPAGAGQDRRRRDAAVRLQRQGRARTSLAGQ